MDLLKLGLMAGGAYLLYETGILSSLTGGLFPAPASPGLPSGTPQNPATPSPSNPASPGPDTRGLLLSTVQKYIQNNAGAKFQGSLSYPLITGDQWNYFYNQVRGRDPLGAGVTVPAGNISVDEFWGPVSAAGFSGLTSRSVKVPQNFNTPEPRNTCARVPGMGRWIY